MKRVIIDLLERLRVKKSKRQNTDAALTVTDAAPLDASFSEDDVATTTQSPSHEKVEDVGLSLPRSCMNCEEVLTGPYCFSCGQKEGDIRRPIWSLLSELLDNVVAPDSKLFKTLLLLLFMPGKLTRDYNSGKRARFIPPLRLYITITFAFFALLLVADVLILDINFTKKDGTYARPETSEVIKEAVDAANGSSASDVNQDGSANEFLGGLAEGWNAYEPEKKTPTTPDIPEMVKGEPAASTSVGKPFALSDAQEEQIDDLQDEIEDLTEEGGELSAAMKRLQEKFGDRIELDTDELTDEERRELAKIIDEELGQVPAIARDAIKNAVLNGGAKIDVQDLLDGDFGASAFQIDGRSIDIDSDEFPYNVSFGMFVKRSEEERDSIDAAELREWVSNDDKSEEVENMINNFAEAMRDPRQFNELFNDWLPQTLFVMVPFFALILRLFHWGKKRYYFNQLIFSLHFHSFLFLIFIGFIFIIPVTGAELAGPVFWGMSSIYMIVALKYGQDQGWIKAFIKAGFIWVSYSFILTSTLFSAVMFGLSGGNFGDLIAAIF
jgi:hypothetical protein